MGVCETSLLMFSNQAHLIQHVWERACVEPNTHYALLSPAVMDLPKALVLGSKENGRLAALHSGGLVNVTEHYGVMLANGAWIRAVDPRDAFKLGELGTLHATIVGPRGHVVPALQAVYYWVDVACLVQAPTPLHAFLLQKAASGASSFSLYTLAEPVVAPEVPSLFVHPLARMVSLFQKPA